MWSYVKTCKLSALRSIADNECLNAMEHKLHVEFVLSGKSCIHSECGKEKSVLGMTSYDTQLRVIFSNELRL